MRLRLRHRGLNWVGMDRLGLYAREYLGGHWHDKEEVSIAIAIAIGVDMAGGWKGRERKVEAE